MLVRNLFAAITMIAAFSVYGQVEVEDRPSNLDADDERFPSRQAEQQRDRFDSAEVGTSNTILADQPPTPVQMPAQQTGDFYYQIQILQQEVLQLRGLVEEQAHEIKKLKQQRLDDYLDLDRRLSRLGQPGSTTDSLADDTSNTSSDVSSGGVASTAAPSSSVNELQSYRTAIDLVLKKKEYDQALESLKAHLNNFPNGRYAGNVQYWLGEIYLSKSEYELSREWFTRLLTEFPTHRKIPDAKFKLGKVYDLLGNKDKAKTLLEDVAGSNSNAASLARDYLKTHFSS